MSQISQHLHAFLLTF